MVNSALKRAHASLERRRPAANHRRARLRHASAKTTLDTYGHIWPDRDESTRAAVDAVLTAYLSEQRRNNATADS